MSKKNSMWKVAVFIYACCYLSLSLMLYNITGRGNIGAIIAIGMVIALPYVIYNLFRKEQNELPEEPDIENLY